MIWQTRTLAQFVAATVQTDGSSNPLVDLASGIGQPENAQQDQPAAAAQPANEPSVGSFERFMHSFGSPARWAGR